MTSEVVKTGDGDDLVVGPASLSPKEELFCKAWGSVESETFGKATASARVAGYSEPHQASWRLRRRPRIIARLKEYEEMAAADLGRVMATIERTRILAEEKGDHATALRAAELQGRRLGAFFERSVLTLDVPAQHEYSERVALESSRLARLLIEEDGDRILGLPVPGEPVLEGKTVGPAALGALPDGERKQLNEGQKEDGA